MTSLVLKMSNKKNFKDFEAMTEKTSKRVTFPSEQKVILKPGFH